MSMDNCIVPYGNDSDENWPCCVTENSASTPPPHSSYRPGMISTSRIRRPGRLQRVTVIRIAVGSQTVKPWNDTCVSRFSVTVLVK